MKSTCQTSREEEGNVMDGSRVEEFSYEVAFQRNFGLLREGDLRKIRSARVGIGAGPRRCRSSSVLVGFD